MEISSGRFGETPPAPAATARKMKTWNETKCSFLQFIGRHRFHDLFIIISLFMDAADSVCCARSNDVRFWAHGSQQRQCIIVAKLFKKEQSTTSTTMTACHARGWAILCTVCELAHTVPIENMKKTFSVHASDDKKTCFNLFGLMLVPRSVCSIYK